MPASVVARTGANRLRTKTRSRTRLGSTAARAALRSLPTNSGQDTRTSPLPHSPCLDLCQRELHVIRSIDSSLCKCTTRQGRADVGPVHLIAAIAANQTTDGIGDEGINSIFASHSGRVPAQ